MSRAGCIWSASRIVHFHFEVCSCVYAHTLSLRNVQFGACFFKFVISISKSVAVCTHLFRPPLTNLHFEAFSWGYLNFELFSVRSEIGSCVCTTTLTKFHLRGVAPHTIRCCFFSNSISVAVCIHTFTLRNNHLGVYPFRFVPLDFLI